MELRTYLALVRKWAWLIVLLVALAAAGSFAYSRTIPPVYQSETTLMVGQDQTATANASADAAVDVAAPYAILATQPAVLQAAADALQWTDSWQSLYFHVTATSVSNRLVRISATAGTPEMAQAIASQIAQQIILHDPILLQQGKNQEERDFVTRQQHALRQQIETAQATLADLDTQAKLENDPQRAKDLDARMVALQERIDNWQKTYAQLLAATTTGSQFFLTVLAPANLPQAPISPNIPLNILLAAAVGLAFAAGIVLLLEYLDDTIKDREDARRELALSTLGVISRMDHLHKPADRLITVAHPRAPISEAYRVLRTNLRFSGIENPGAMVLVTSANPAEGKTTTAANLAVALAQGGKRVILVDTDLRRPSMHTLFGLSNEIGLSHLFVEETVPPEQIMQTTDVLGLQVLSSGPLPPNPAELLDSKKLSEILKILRAHADFVILDSPPTLAVADASILGAMCSGTLLVIDAGRTRSDAARRAVETLYASKSQILGVVLNKMSSKRAPGYGYYYYNSASGDGAANHKPAKSKK